MSSRLGKKAVELLACDYCKQPVGKECVTSTGQTATLVHSARYYPVQTIWVEGYQEGSRDAVLSIKDNKGVIPKWLETA